MGTANGALLDCRAMILLFPEPTSPPPEPPLSLWASLGVLAVGILLAGYLVFVVLRSKGTDGTATNETGIPPTDSNERATADTEHRDEGVV